MAICRYMKERCAADYEYANALNTSLHTLPYEKGNASNGSLKAVTAEVHAFQTALRTSIKQAASEAEQGLLHAQLGPVLIDFEKKFSEVSRSFTALSSETISLDERAAKHFREHSNTFQKLETQFSRGKVASGCVWLTERRYITAVSELLNLHRVFAGFIVQQTKDIQELELRRVEVILTVMGEFIRRQSTVFLQDNSAAVAAVEAVEPRSNCSISALLDEGDALILAELNQAENLETSLLTWTLAVPESTPLIVFESNCLSKSQIWKTWHPAYLVLTKDGFLHCFNSPPSEVFADPICTIVTATAHLTFTLAARLLEIEILSQRRFLGLYSSSQRYQFKFADESVTEACREATEKRQFD